MLRPGLVHQQSQGGMVGLMDRLKSCHRLGHGQRSIVDILSISGPARDDPIACSNPCTRRSLKARAWNVLDEQRIKVARRSVQIDIGSADMGHDERDAQLRRSLHQLIDPAVFGAAQRACAQGRSDPHIRRIATTRMGRGKHKGTRRSRRTADFKARFICNGT